MRISEIPEEIRPREKALRNGIDKLTDQELIALIIGSGVAGNSVIDIAESLLKTNCYSLLNLSSTNLESLQRYKGLKKNNALKLLATFEFHRRLNSPIYLKSETISSAKEVYYRYKYLEDYEQEVLIILMLDSKYRLKKEKTLYVGTHDSFTVNINEVIRELVLSQTKAFILIHNHPDESSKPSNHDIVTTKAIEKNSKNIGIKMLDHVIVYKGGYYSFRMKND